MREPKSVMVEGVVGHNQVLGDEWELEVQVVKDVVVDSGKLVKLKLCGLGAEPLKESNFVVVEVGSLEDVKVPLAFLSVSWQVVDVAGNGRLM